MIVQSLSLVAGELRRYGVEPCTSLHCGPLGVLGDEVQLGQVIINLVRNAAANRLDGAERLAEIGTLLAGDLLTANQRTLLEAERESLTIPDPISETYAINAQPVNIRVLRGTALRAKM